MTSVIAGMKSFGIIPTEFIGSVVERGSGAKYNPKLTNLQCLRKQNLGVSTQALLPRWSPFGDFGPHGDQNEIFGPHLVPIFFQSPHFLHFRLKNASKVSAATI